MYLPQPSRLLLNALYLKLNQKSKNFGKNLSRFNNELCTMNTNGLILYNTLTTSTDPVQQEAWEALKSNGMISFLCTHGQSSFDVTLDNYRLLLNLHFAIECNSFGISKSDQIRCGTALYFPTNLINHSCRPNAFIKFSGKKQFLIAN